MLPLRTHIIDLDAIGPMTASTRSEPSMASRISCRNVRPRLSIALPSHHDFSREEIGEQLDVRIAPRLGRRGNVIVDGIYVCDYSTRRQREVA
jgi:hypothetical protein